jgi:Tol biopolymer transport system component
MKKLIGTMITVAIVIALAGCGSDSKPAGLLTYVSRASGGDGTPQLFTLNPTTKVSKAVAIPIPAYAEYVSPNSTATAVTYSYNGPNGYDVFTMGTDGKEVELTTGADAWGANFSPDGKTIAYVSGINDEIYTMNVDGSNPQAFYAAGVDSIYESEPAFSSDGKSLVFYVNTDDCCSVPVGKKIRASWTSKAQAVVRNTVHPQDGVPTQNGWYTMATTGTTPTLVYATDDSWGPAVYSADGTKLLLSVIYGGQWNIISVNLDGSNITALTTGTATYTISPVPYQNLIFYNVLNANNDEEFDIYSMSQTGANQTLISGVANTFESLNDAYYENY